MLVSFIAEVRLKILLDSPPDFPGVISGCGAGCLKTVFVIMTEIDSKDVKISVLNLKGLVKV